MALLAEDIILKKKGLEVICSYSPTSNLDMKAKESLLAAMGSIPSGTITSSAKLWARYYDAPSKRELPFIKLNPIEHSSVQVTPPKGSTDFSANASQAEFSYSGTKYIVFFDPK